MKKWNEISDISVKRFLSHYEDEVIYVINTGFQDKWMVINEDAHERTLGTAFIGTKIEVEQEFDIKL
jgi:hypothetical protein